VRAYIAQGLWEKTPVYIGRKVTQRMRRKLRYRLLGMLVLLAGASVPFAGKQSTQKFKSDASGVFGRTLFSAPGPANTTITIRDVMVGPRRSQTIPASPGSALVEWFEGHGTFSVAGGAPQTIGNEFDVIPAGQVFVVNNPNGPSIGFRLYVFAGE